MMINTGFVKGNFTVLSHFYEKLEFLVFSVVQLLRQRFFTSFSMTRRGGKAVRAEILQSLRSFRMTGFLSSSSERKRAKDLVRIGCAE